jgi:hypothetical protein
MHYAKLDEVWCASAKQSSKSKALENFRPKRTAVYSLAFQEFDPIQYFYFGSCSLFIPSVSGTPTKIVDFERERKFRNASMRSFLFSMHDISLGCSGR